MAFVFNLVYAPLVSKLVRVKEHHSLGCQREGMTAGQKKHSENS